MIDTVIFDIGGVLTDFHNRDFCHNFGFSEEVADRVFKAVMDSAQWVEYDRGILSDETILSLFQKNDPGVAAEIAQTLADTHGLVTRRDTAIPWIRHVKATGRRVLVLSNFGQKIFNECQDALDFLPETDGGIISYMEKCVKPDPEIYELLIRRYHLDPARCVFIDDTKINLTAAAEAGLRTIWFRSLEQAQADLDAMLQEE